MIGTLITLVVLIVAAIVGVYLVVMENVRKYGEPKRSFFLASGWTLAGVGTVAAVILGILWASFVSTSYAKVQDLRAFYGETQTAYTYAIATTQTLVLDAQQTRERALTDFAYRDQGVSAADRIKEFRDAIESYNKSRAWLIAANKIPIIGGMYYDFPDDLPAIKFASGP